jgi:hypothetical protein
MILPQHQQPITVRLATAEDVKGAKEIADRCRKELGFVNLAILKAAQSKGWLLVAAASNAENAADKWEHASGDTKSRARPSPSDKVPHFLHPQHATPLQRTDFFASLTVKPDEMEKMHRLWHENAHRFDWKYGAPNPFQRVLISPVVANKRTLAFVRELKRIGETEVMMFDSGGYFVQKGDITYYDLGRHLRFTGQSAIEPRHPHGSGSEDSADGRRQPPTLRRPAGGDSSENNAGRPCDSK